jgi:phage tail-like protein
MSAEPYLGARFLLEIQDVERAGFSECRLPASRTQVVEYREGNEFPTPRKLWGLTEYEPLVLSVGLSRDTQELFEWRQQVQAGRLAEARRDVAVVLLDAEGEPAARWEFRRAWPAEYDAPDLDASESAVAIERLVVVHEGMERVEVGETDGGEADEEPEPPEKPTGPSKPGPLDEAGEKVNEAAEDLDDLVERGPARGPPDRA